MYHTLRATVAIALAAAAACAFAQPAGKGIASADYPNRSIRFLIPFSPGGTADIIARAIAPKMTEGLGQQVVVDNRGGSSGIIGSEIAANSRTDGYTLMLSNTATIAVNPALYAKLPYDPVRDFTAVTLLAAAPYLLLVPPSLPAKNVKEMLLLAKARPGELAYGSTGSGSLGHLAGDLFATMGGVKLLHVPYKNIGQLLTDLISGQVQLLFLGLVSSQSHVKAGKLRALAISSNQRFPIMQDVPTVSESGVKGYEVSGWYGLFVPAGTPPEIVSRLHKETVRAIGLPDVRDRLSGQGAELIGNTPEQFAAYVKSEIAKWAKVVKLSGAKVD